MKIKLSILLVLFSITCMQAQKNKISKGFDYGNVENDKYQNSFFDLELTFNPEWIVQDRKQTEELVEAGKEMVAGDNKQLEQLINASNIQTAYLFTVLNMRLAQQLNLTHLLLSLQKTLRHFQE